MPGFELIGSSERKKLNQIFTKANGVMFAHGFTGLRNGQFLVREFEKKFSLKLGSKYTQAVTSGTVAQQVAMLGMGIKPGDEVITQSFTFVATVETIIAIGAIPVIVDIDDTFNMDPVALEKAISKKTKLIVPVHMLGNPASMKQISKIGKKYNIPVLEDACEALGASYMGKNVGTLSDAAIFSLDFGKTITSGEGGMITTSNKKLYKFCKEYHDHGHESNPKRPRGRDTRTIPGMNFRMTEMQGAVALAQLEKLDKIVDANRKNKTLLKSNINDSKIQFRRLTDKEGDLADTLIFTFSKKKYANKFVREYNRNGYFTKNVPDAIDWHFAGTWNHMFESVARYKDTWKTEWAKSADLLDRSVSIPIFVKQKKKQCIKHALDINNILDKI